MMKCSFCEAEFKCKNIQQQQAFEKYGRVFCSKSCKGKARHRRTYKSVSKVREFECGQCGSSFKSDSGKVYGHSKKGKVYCSKKCSTKMSNSLSRSRAPFANEPCPTCEKPFRSTHKGKIYCSMDCYTSSESFRDRVLSMNQEHRVNRLKEAGIEILTANPSTRTIGNRLNRFKNRIANGRKLVMVTRGGRKRYWAVEPINSANQDGGQHSLQIAENENICCGQPVTQTKTHDGYLNTNCDICGKTFRCTKL